MTILTLVSYRKDIYHSQITKQSLPALGQLTPKQKYFRSCLEYL